MDNKKILYSFCELLRVFEFTNRVMLTVFTRLQTKHVDSVGLPLIPLATVASAPLGTTYETTAVAPF